MSLRTFYFCPIRSLETSLPVEGLLSETFGQLANRLCERYCVAGGIYIIARTLVSNTTPLASLPADATNVTVWLNRDSYPPYQAVVDHPTPMPEPTPEAMPILNEEEEEEDGLQDLGSSQALQLLLEQVGEGDD
jgi:hypothetical protein